MIAPGIRTKIGEVHSFQTDIIVQLIGRVDCAECMKWAKGIERTADRELQRYRICHKVERTPRLQTTEGPVHASAQFVCP